MPPEGTANLRVKSGAVQSRVRRTPLARLAVAVHAHDRAERPEPESVNQELPEPGVLDVPARETADVGGEPWEAAWSGSASGSPRPRATALELKDG